MSVANFAYTVFTMSNIYGVLYGQNYSLDALMGESECRK